MSTDAANLEEVVIVDEHDHELGTMEKLAAHRDGGRLHRAFSVFLFDDRGRLLLQQRAASKYHFGGLWANTCCSHPRRGESPVEAGARRLVEELGIGAVELSVATTFTYRAHDEASGLTEHEFDHVLVGRFGGEPKPNPDEVQAVRWVDTEELDRELAERPEVFSPWFPIALRALRSAQRSR
ncbi:MAG: isopentenyl-diphosphate Delta-isomerase [Planctomycetota bacterium]